MLAGQTRAAKWYPSLTLWWRWADFMRLSFPCRESDLSVTWSRWTETQACMLSSRPAGKKSDFIYLFLITQLYFLLAFVQIASSCCFRAGPISKQSKQSARDWTNDLGGLQGACRCESSYWLGSMQAFLPLVSLSPSHFPSNLGFFANPPLCSGGAGAIILILNNE